MNDKDFGELVYLQGKNNIGIILMRFVSEKSAVKTRLVSHLSNNSDCLIDHFTVIREAKIRFRKLRRFGSSKNLLTVVCMIFCLDFSTNQSKARTKFFNG